MLRCVLAATLAVITAADTASATTGFGCYRVNTGPSDPLTVRDAPRESAAAIGSLTWNDSPIIALQAPTLRGEGVQPDLFDVWQAEFEVCVPRSLPVGARWCPVMLFGDDTTLSGWVKRRFLDHSECP